MLSPFHIGDRYTNTQYIQEEKWPVMQYTGLKDKNGVEIYEGDIVTHFHPTLLSDDRAIGVVVWSPKESSYTYAGWYVSSKEHFAILMGTNVEYEVIGNIHENLELLK